MSNSMFCFQCEQVAGGKACTRVGACGKQPATSNLQDDLTVKLIELAMFMEGEEMTDHAAELMMEGLFTTITNVNFNDDDIKELTGLIQNQIDQLKPQNSGCGSCCGAGQADITRGEELFHGDADEVALRTLLLLGLRGMAAYAYHAYVLGRKDPEVTEALFRGMREVGTHHRVDAWLKILHQFGLDNYRCMELLDEANTGAYGHPVPTPVTMTIEPGPFIVVSGHDLLDLKMLLDQTAGKGINIYTHGEMLPAHGYPELKKYPHLKGNFGTAWQNQQKEFRNVPGAFLFTTNCLMPPRKDYADRVFTTAVVGYPGLVHIPDSPYGKDFGPVIEKALALGGYDKPVTMKGVNGGSSLITGFGHESVLAAAGEVVEAVKSGAIRHIFLVGGCDGAKPGRNYYTDFVAATPPDTLVLTLACGKYRFNDLDLGKIGPFPRIMDMGQCNDAYSAIRVAVKLAEVFETDINQLPLTLVLSWYEQKAICVLLSLLSLGVKNIRLGPTLPAFVSENVLGVLVNQFGLSPVSNAEADLKAVLG
ncbi:MAG: hydroxylamine reductase [Clostridiaceae bacterium]|nr:hydroxylamine reductase [Eubacteriales bacterium]MDD4139953.1 hydroxylamine reductase [Eubacteriales bacterium]NLB43761.1 hydroxylamine reductase [Clostridiaceae bacterium]